MAKIAEMQEVSLDLLKPYERNAKIHGEEQIELLMNSIREFGFLSPCLVERDTFNLIAGHGRVEAAKRLGMEKVPCVFVEDITEEQRRAYILADNRLTELGTWDMDMVNIELGELDDMGFDVSVTGFDFEADPPEISEDEYEEHDVQPRAKRGDVYQLGDHRLMCGDSTSSEDVQMLMGGVLADMVFTDPPYGVSYTDKNEFLNSIDKPLCVVDAIQNDDMPPEEMHDFWVAAFKNLYQFTKDRMSYYITAPQGGDLLLLLLQAVRESGFALKHQLIWNKNNHVLGRCDYNYKHEPIVYGWKIGGTHEFVGGGEMKTSVWDVAKPLRSDLHPTMKPVELVANAVLNSSKPGDVVLDLFGGSGTTIVACEQSGRKCYMMEYEAHYVDVIINRWEQLTGGRAVLLNG